MEHRIECGNIVIEHTPTQVKMFKKFGGCTITNSKQNVKTQENDDSVEKTIELFNRIVLDRLK